MRVTEIAYFPHPNKNRSLVVFPARIQAAEPRIWILVSDTPGFQFELLGFSEPVSSLGNSDGFTNECQNLENRFTFNMCCLLLINDTLIKLTFQNIRFSVKNGRGVS